MRSELVFIIMGAIVSAAPSATLWQPAVGSTWQIVLSKTVDGDAVLKPDVAVYDLDMATTSAGTIKKLKTKGKSVICYFSAGSSEEGRSDNESLKPFIGAELQGWPGEHWLDTRQKGVRDVMKARIAAAASKGCDAIDPDNMDGYVSASSCSYFVAEPIDHRFLFHRETRMVSVPNSQSKIQSITSNSSPLRRPQRA